MTSLNPFRLILASVKHFRRTHLATGFAQAVLTAAMAGALIVGDSVRTSLYDAAVSRIGPYDYAITPNRLIREDLANELGQCISESGQTQYVSGSLQLIGGASHAVTSVRAGRVQVIGIEGRADCEELRKPFLGDSEPIKQAAKDSVLPEPFTGRNVILNDVLAHELKAKKGDDIVLRIRKPTAISEETLLGRRDESTVSLRVTVQGILPTKNLAAFSLNPAEFQPRNAFVPLETLQRAIEQPKEINTILIDAHSHESMGMENANAKQPAPLITAAELCDCVNSKLTLADLDLTLRANPDKAWLSLESSSFLIDPQIESAARAVIEKTNAPHADVLAYLANTISLKPSGEPASAPPKSRDVPYSIVVALDNKSSAQKASLKLTDGTPAPNLEPGQILLNDWTAAELGAKQYDTVCLTYYITADFGQLETRDACFTVRGIVTTASTADPTWTPEYKGITDAKNLADWNPPFPLEISRIKNQDEEYWDHYTAAPKAIISLADGRRLWAEQGERFGRLTSIRIAAATNQTLEETKLAFEKELRACIDWPAFGFGIQPLREQMTAASRGSTDFGMLFISFSFFLIIAAATLASLLFRLLVERRASEIGLILATGQTSRTITRLLLAEGAIVAGLGSALGLIGSIAYSWAMLTGLSTWWSAALQTPFLHLSVSPTSLIIGFATGFLISLGSIAYSVRGVTKWHPRALLAGALRSESALVSGPRSNTRRTIAIASFVLAIALVFAPLVTNQIPQVAAFFGGGVLLLTASILLISATLRRASNSRISSPDDLTIPLPLRERGRGEGLLNVNDGAHSNNPSGVGRSRFPLLRLAFSNLRRHPSRSVMTMTLIASAVFVIVSVGAFRLDVADSTDRHSGTGGFSLIAESAVPLQYDLNTPEGRKSLNFSDDESQSLDNVRAMPFRLRPGDDASCKNPYSKKTPRILGATEEMIARGGFTFAGSLAESSDEKENPWLLLDRKLSSDSNSPSPSWGEGRGEGLPADSAKVPPKTELDAPIPVIADESAIRWQLHLNLGQDLIIPDDHGQLRKLRIVGMLKNSVLQSEVIMSESNFTRLFPSRSGYSFFLIDTEHVDGMTNRSTAIPHEMSEGGTVKRSLAVESDDGSSSGMAKRSAAMHQGQEFALLSQSLEHSLAPFVFDVQPASDRLREFLVVQNTYISTFQTLGGLGLLLGVAGLAAILVRQVWERRSELALMTALGFNKSHVKRVVQLENAAVLITGIALGSASALIAIAPQWLTQPEVVPWLKLAATLALVITLGLTLATLALNSALGKPLLPALRSE